jgi:hypothetical protein
LSRTVEARGRRQLIPPAVIEVDDLHEVAVFVRREAFVRSVVGERARDDRDLGDALDDHATPARVEPVDKLARARVPDVDADRVRVIGRTLIVGTGIPEHAGDEVPPVKRKERKSDAGAEWWRELPEHLV